MRALALAASLLVLACTEDEQRGAWTRVVESGYESQYYSFVHADREADICVTLGLGEVAPPGGGPIDEVEVQGGNYIVVGAWGTPYTPECTNRYYEYWETDNLVTGKVTFDDFDNTLEPDAPCTVSFELEIEGVDGQQYAMSAEKFPILDVGCPRPGVYAVEYTQLDAAVGAHEGSDTIVISTWDAAREVCVWGRLSKDPELPSSEVDVPVGWVYSGLRFGLTEHADCSAAQLVHPPINPPWPTQSVDGDGATGTVRFADSDDAGWPCTIDVELDLRSYGRYDWTPDDVHIEAKGVPVAGACD